MPHVVIWRSHLLAGSETFIRNQADALTTWRPTYLGAVRVVSALSRDTDVLAFRGTGPDRRDLLALKVTGRSARLTRLLRRLRPALVHAHFGGDGWLISRTAADLRIPLVVTVHGRDVTRQPALPGLRGARQRRNLRVAFERAAVVVAVSDFIRDRAIALGADPAKVQVHHIGVPIPALPAATPPVWDVAFVGRFVEKKGVDDLVEALGLLRPRRPRVLFIGTGPLEGPLRARAAQLDLDATFLGAQPPAVVSHHLAQSKLFAAPSRTAADGDSEGLPITILEAASLGLPVVSTYHSGIPEAVVPGETGLLGAEGDRPALAGNIARLLDDDALRQRLGHEARRHVEDRFDLHKQTRRLEKLYDEVAGTPPVGR
ncbi:glycosyltransferase [Micromonospora sp. WMMA1363]|uniref:glycosyltransferase n=1 Tax=Micromonospora sp. WMMA1363 TaxID=3053985 RepID=UPI00259C8B44|nr:glycosyltransferase [Micromonospora sp. WMMA1363]MDM4718746.1 glycosyltransferase [Micromonospora sp. WMMA1363]